MKEREATAGFNLAATRLTGIVRGQMTLVLIETAEGMGYILKAGDTLGEGRLLGVRADSVVFELPPRPGRPTNRVVLKLPSG